MMKLNESCQLLLTFTLLVIGCTVTVFLIFALQQGDPRFHYLSIYIYEYPEKFRFYLLTMLIIAGTGFTLFVLEWRNR